MIGSYKLFSQGQDKEKVKREAAEREEKFRKVEMDFGFSFAY